MKGSERARMAEGSKVTNRAERGLMADGRSALTNAQRDAIFARRAESLAAAAPGEAAGNTLEALVFGVGSELYAFPATQVKEVRPLGWLTPLPGTPACIAGLINVRGRIVPVIDVRPLLGVRVAEGPAPSVVLVANRGGDIGVLATDRPTMRLLRSTDLAEPPACVSLGIDPTAVRGIAPGPVLVLDAERLLADPRFVIQHDLP